MARTTCAFCHRTATLTGEHLFSDWIDRLLTQITPGRRWDFRTRAGGPDGPVTSEWRKGRLDWQTKVACGSCNSGWMGRIDNEHAKPVLSGMLQGRAVLLPPAEIGSLAIFAFKTALVVAHMLPRRPTFFLPSVRTAFRERLAIPGGVQMWLGAMHEPGFRDGLVNSYYVTVRGGPMRGFQYLIVTWGLAPVVLQVASCRWTKPGRRRQEFPPLNQNAALDEASILFWPSPGAPVRWPPPRCFGRDSISDYVYRWRELLRVTSDESSR